MQSIILLKKYMLQVMFTIIRNVTLILVMLLNMIDMINYFELHMTLRFRLKDYQELDLTSLKYN